MARKRAALGWLLALVFGFLIGREAWIWAILCGAGAFAYLVNILDEDDNE